MFKTTRLMLVGSAASAALCYAPLAHAQAADAVTVPTPKPGPSVDADESVEQAGTGTVSDIVVTGSRVATVANSPTPLTTISTEQLVKTAPSNLPDALRKLPQFIGTSQRNSGNSGSNGAANTLNLRGFGAIRTLILLDGARVPATAANGTVDINTIPQMLIERVDVVTGGASAVYGSDAITGVVNFVLNRKFEGVRAIAQAGISDFGDAESYRLGIAGGSSLLDGRLHLEGSAEHYYSAGIGNKLDRPLGRAQIIATGNGTAANPFVGTPNSRVATFTPGGYLSIPRTANPPAGALQGDYFFSADGVLTPFTHGLRTGSAGLESGGDGGSGNLGYGYGADSTLQAKLRTTQIFARADYEVSDRVHAYLQGSYSEAFNAATSFPQWFTRDILTTNPYLPEAARAGLAANGTTRFALSRSIQNYPGNQVQGKTRNYNITSGIEGTLAGNIRWNAYYTHAVTKLNQGTLTNINQERLIASLDAVRDPSGQIVCRVSLTPEGRARFPGCLPTNPFGPTSITAGAYDYFDDPTDFDLTNKLDNFAGSVTAEPFSTWAGPVSIALSAEHRRFSLNIDSDFIPTLLVDCAALNTPTCPARPPSVWTVNVVAPTSAKQNVTEGAIEVNVPLLRDTPFFQSLDLNGAARRTHYSVTGNATTWKVGLVWSISDELRLRGTRSRDFRAPTLIDLYNPAQTSPTGYTDALTNSAGSVTVQSQGNADLRPEVANTITIGGVFRPNWLPGLSVAVDWYKIKINNAITNVSGANVTVQNECIRSGGSSPFCAFTVRPFPISNTTAANFPILILSQPFNAARTRTTGVDVDVNYRTSVPGLFAGGGLLDLRLVGSYQPTLLSQSLPGAVTTDAAGAAGLAEWRGLASVDYSSGPFSLTVIERYQSSRNHSSDPNLIFAARDIPETFYTDLTLSYAFGEGSGREKPITAFVTVENLFDREPHLWLQPGQAGGPGFNYAAPPDEDIIGRYFTAGVRMRF